MPAQVTEQLGKNNPGVQDYVFPGEVLRLDRLNTLNRVARTIMILCQKSDFGTDIYEFARPDDEFDGSNDYSDEVLENCTPANLKATLRHEKRGVITIPQDSGEVQIITVDHRVTMAQN